MQMEEFICPPALRRGDTVGVIAPSSPAAARYPQRFSQSIAALERTFGVTVRLADHVRARGDYRSAAPRARAEELQELIVDSSVSALFVTIGGYNSAEILPMLDQQLLMKNPKILVGYSDVTALLVGIQALAGWYTFHGPTLMTDFGEVPTPHPFTVAGLSAEIAVSEAHSVVQDRFLTDPATWTNEFLDWGTDAWKRARQAAGSGVRAVWRDGEGSGCLFGGNLSTLNYLLGTPYFSPPERIVLFVEATGDEAALPQLQRSLVHLEQVGIFNRTAALLIGRSPDAKESEGRTLRTVVSEVVRDYDFPIVAELPFGHTSPMWTLPLGVRATVSASDGVAEILLRGWAVR